MVDAHVHPVQGGLERIRCDLSEATTREEYVGAVRAYSLTHPALEWLVGGGWGLPSFPDGAPTRRQLDALVAFIAEGALPSALF